MIKKSSEMVTELKENMRDGEGITSITHIYHKEELKGNSRLCAKIILQPGGSIGNHIHENEEEVYYILNGKGLVIDNGTPTKVGVGDAVLTRDGASHSIENIGDEPLEFMAIINLY